MTETEKFILLTIADLIAVAHVKGPSGRCCVNNDELHNNLVLILARIYKALRDGE